MAVATAKRRPVRASIDWVRAGTGAALVVSVVWFALQVHQWYFPYLFNVGPTDWYPEHGYDKTIHVLPPVSGRVVTPDPRHNMLQLLSITVVVAAATA